MGRASPSVIPPRMYRHFAVATVLLTAGVALFADGERRQTARAPHDQVAERETRPRGVVTEAAKPSTARASARSRTAGRNTGRYDGFDSAFGMPTDKALGSIAARRAEVAWETAPAGYSEGYLASLEASERELLLKGLDDEGMLSAEQRERKSAALVTASQSRSGGTAENY